MIPTRLHPVDQEVLVVNIIRSFRSATPEQIHKGREWYPVAHDIASMLADGDVRTGAGLLAAFSPQTEWLYNIRLACDAWESGTPRGHVGDALSKANRILAGIDPAEVLPMGRKTGHFYRLILDPSDPVAVCVDRHAHDIAVGQRYGSASRGLGTASRYETLATAYRTAARELFELPSVVQAVTWTVQTEAHRWERTT